MKTTNNVKSLGVPSEVHAKALELALLYDLKVYEVVSKAKIHLLEKLWI